MANGPAIGIDLGTSYSRVAVFRHGKVEVIPNERGNLTTPSYVAFTSTGRQLGEAAKDQVRHLKCLQLFASYLWRIIDLVSAASIIFWFSWQWTERSGRVASWEERLTRISAEITHVKRVVVVVVVVVVEHFYIIYMYIYI